VHPLDDLWYLNGDGGALGPYKGAALKAMLEAGSVGADAMVARVGASQWSPIGDVPVFASSAGKAVRYAGFWIRLLAYFIDVLILYAMIFVVATVVGFVVGYAAGGSDPPPEDLALRLFGAFVAVAIACFLFYFIYFPSGKWQATPGKRICGIHIIRVAGGRVTGLLALGRYLSYTVSGFPLGVGFLMIGWNAEKKGLHDMVCATRVIYGRL
jgi:uncharacterized RDD family membrane protein YckC